MRKPLLMCLVLILTLGVVGSGYACWSEDVLIRANAASGDLAVGVRCLSVDDWCCCRCCRGEDCPQETAGISWNDGPYEFDLYGSTYLKSVDLNITNCCPCFTPGCTLEIANGGTIPARIKNLYLDWSSNTGAVALGDWTLVFPDGYQANGSGYAGLQEVIRGAVLDTGQTMRVELGFQCRCKADLAVCSVSVDYVRWNKDL